MYDVFKGVRVVEVASWVFAPTAAAILADWGADVIKVEDRVAGDAVRGLSNALTVESGFNPMFALSNRGKRSIALDLEHADGREQLYRLVEGADVFITSMRADARARLAVDVEHIRRRNPDIICALATGQGSVGPDANKGGFDLASTWARSGMAYQLTPPDGEPPMMPGSIGDLTGAMTAAGAIAAALYQRERTGEAAVVEVSLYGVGMWMMSQAITAAPLGLVLPLGDRRRPPNPIVNCYRTRDDRWIWLVMMQADRYWPDLCTHLGRPDLVSDPRFVDSAARARNLSECISTLDEIFATRTFAEWRSQLETLSGVWAPVLSPSEVARDPQAVLNGYVTEIAGPDGTINQMVASPVQFGARPVGMLTDAPEHGQHTEEILLELGLSWDEIGALKEANAIL